MKLTIVATYFLKKMPLDLHGQGKSFFLCSVVLKTATAYLAASIQKATKLKISGKFILLSRFGFLGLNKLASFTGSRLFFIRFLPSFPR